MIDLPATVLPAPLQCVARHAAISFFDLDGGLWLRTSTSAWEYLLYVTFPYAGFSHILPS